MPSDLPIAVADVGSNKAKLILVRRVLPVFVCS